MEKLSAAERYTLVLVVLTVSPGVSPTPSRRHLGSPWFRFWCACARTPNPLIIPAETPLAMLGCRVVLRGIIHIDCHIQRILLRKRPQQRTTKRHLSKAINDKCYTCGLHNFIGVLLILLVFLSNRCCFLPWINIA